MKKRDDQINPNVKKNGVNDETNVEISFFFKYEHVCKKSFNLYKVMLPLLPFVGYCALNYLVD